MNCRIFFKVFFCFISLSAAAQQQNDLTTLANQLYKDGEVAVLQHQYRKALKLFEKAYRMKPDLLAAHRGAGDCLVLLADYHTGLEKYLDVVQKDSLFSRIIYFEIGETFYKIGDYNNAVQYLEKFGYLQGKKLEEFGYFGQAETDQEVKYLLQLNSILRTCHIAMDSIKFQNISEVINLGEHINTKADEYFPFVTNSQDLMFFTRRLQGKDENLYYTFENKKHGWDIASAVGPKMNTIGNEGMSTFVRDGKQMYFTACNREEVYGTCDIWEAYLYDDEAIKFRDFQSVEGKANSNGWESQASISCDGRYLFFASNREGGYGGTDIWRSKRQDDGTWGKPLNLGPVVNTDKDEESPFITDDGQTLYFSSTGHLGLGEQDIFMSRHDEYGHWSTPVNLGPPVNSSYRELGFFLSADGGTGYFASNREEGFGGMDIYKFELSEQLHSEPITYVEGFVIDSVLNTPIQTTINIEGRPPIETDEDGRFFVCATGDEFLDITVEEKGFKPYNRNFRIMKWDNKDYFTIELSLSPTISFLFMPEEEEPDSAIIRKKKKKALKYSHTVFFDFDKKDLKPEQVSDLDDFILPLQDKNIRKVEIVGFSDDIGTNIYNLRLSEKRAKNIALYLMENEILIDQISIEAKGSVKDNKPKSHNRKVEIIIHTLE